MGKRIKFVALLLVLFSAITFTACSSASFGETELSKGRYDSISAIYGKSALVVDDGAQYFVDVETGDKVSEKYSIVSKMGLNGDKKNDYFIATTIKDISFHLISAKDLKVIYEGLTPVLALNETLLFMVDTFSGKGFFRMRNKNNEIMSVQGKEFHFFDLNNLEFFNDSIIFNAIDSNADDGKYFVGAEKAIKIADTDLTSYELIEDFGKLYVLTEETDEGDIVNIYNYLGNKLTADKYSDFQTIGNASKYSEDDSTFFVKAQRKDDGSFDFLKVTIDGIEVLKNSVADFTATGKANGVAYAGDTIYFIASGTKIDGAAYISSSTDYHGLSSAYVYRNTTDLKYYFVNEKGESINDAGGTAAVSDSSTVIYGNGVVMTKNAEGKFFADDKTFTSISENGAYYVGLDADSKYSVLSDKFKVIEGGFKSVTKKAFTDKYSFIIGTIETENGDMKKVISDNKVSSDSYYDVNFDTSLGDLRSDKAHVVSVQTKQGDSAIQNEYKIYSLHENKTISDAFNGFDFVSLPIKTYNFDRTSNRGFAIGKQYNISKDGIYTGIKSQTVINLETGFSFTINSDDAKTEVVSKITSNTIITSYNDLNESYDKIYDMKGKLIVKKVKLPQIYDAYISQKGKTYLRTIKGFKAGVINEKGKEILPNIYDSIQFLNSDVMMATKNGFVGYFTIDGKKLTDVKYIQKFSSAYGDVKIYTDKNNYLDADYVLIDQYGKIILKDLNVQGYNNQADYTNFTKLDMVDYNKKDDEKKSKHEVLKFSPIKFESFYYTVPTGKKQALLKIEKQEAVI